MFLKTKNTKGHIGIALHDGGVVIGQCSWKNGMYSHPQVAHIEQNPRCLTAECWRSFLNQSSMLGSECVISLPPSVAQHQVLRLPNMQTSELKEAASWEMADRLGVERNSLQMDAIPVGSGGDVLAIAIEQTMLTELLDPLYAAGMRPTVIEPSCISAARTLSMLHRRQSDGEIVRAVFDFGMHDSSFMVLAGDSLVFYKHLKHNGLQLIDSVASHTQVTKEQAKRMLENSKVNDIEDDVSKAVRDATRANHEAIATDAMKCIRHYGVTNRGPLSTKLIVTGSAGWNPYLAKALSDACSQKVVSDNAISHVHTLPAEVISIGGWHVALGASLACLSQRRKRRGSDVTIKEAA